MPTPYITLDTRRRSRRGFPVKLYVYHDGKDYGPIGVGWYMEPSEWEDMKKPPRRTPNTVSRIDTARSNIDREQAVLSKARAAIDSIDRFSWVAFKEAYKNPLGDKAKLRYWYSLHERQADTEGTRKWYEDSWKKVSGFAGHRIEINSINPDWLHRLDRHMDDGGLSPTSRSIHIRALKSVINTASAQGHYKNLNPFGKGMFRLPKSRNNKRPLTERQLDAILSCDTSLMAPSYQFALDMFAFSYLCFGANPADIFRLQDIDIKDGRLTFSRVKTEGRANRSVPITVELRGRHLDIIQRWQPFAKEPYLFPVYSPDMSDAEMHRAKKNKVNSVNKRLKKIAHLAGVDVPVSMQYARHTWATLAREKGVEKWVISTLMGHSSPEVTENYFGGVDGDRLRDAQDKTAPGASR